MKCCTPACRRWTVLSFSGVFLVLGILIVLLWNDLVQTIVRHELNVGSDDTVEYKQWKETPIPMYLDVYLYNWSNWRTVVDSNWSEKPSFDQLGPYTFTEKHIRKEVTFNDNNNTVTYKTQRIWHFVPEMSNGSLDDEVTTVNVILLTVANIVKDKHPIVRMAVNFLLEEKRVNLTVTQKVREFTFDGYDDPMLVLLKKLHLKNIDIPFTKFGWFVDRNGSVDYDGIYNMYDGTDDIRKLGLITTWDYTNKTKYYSGSCGVVNGTSGELWYPVQDDPSVQIFASDTCSPLTLYRNGDDEKFGIVGNRYRGTEELFDNGTRYKEMACFSPGEVLPSGVRNVSACKFGAPAFVSYPHFYLADPSYRDAIIGMHPNKSEHELFVSIEPETGIPLEVRAALQINIRLLKVDRISLLENVKELFIPAMWFKEYAQLDEDLANQAKLLLRLPSIGEYTGYAVIGVGSILFLIFAYLTWRTQWKGTEEQGLLNQETM